MAGLNSTPSSIACIGMGSNLGDSRKILLDAWLQLGAVTGVQSLRLSSPYVTEPVSMKSVNRFINAAAVVQTVLDPHKLLEQLQGIEYRAGRCRSSDVSGYQDRTLDLDLLLFNDLVLDTRSLTIPHPLMLERLFVLYPLAEIAGERIHPVTGKSIDAHLLAHPEYGDDNLVAATCWEQ